MSQPREEMLGTCYKSSVPHVSCEHSSWQPLAAPVTGEPETPEQDQRMFTDEECLPEYVKTNLEEVQQAEIDRLREALDLFMRHTSEESGWGSWSRMEGTRIYDDIGLARAKAVAALAPRKANQEVKP
jgi:hypothetical protein